jgi:hypothetical protein
VKYKSRIYRDKSMRLPRVRFRVRRIVMVVMAVVSVCFLPALTCRVVFIICEYEQHKKWYINVEDHILLLADKRPPDVSPSRWAYYLHWTWQLHTNHGGYEYFKRRERERFLRNLDRRLAGKVDVATIDWIWDEYVKNAGAGYYSERFRPTDPTTIRGYFTGQEGSYDLNGWVAKLKVLRERDEQSPRKIPIESDAK